MELGAGRRAEVVGRIGVPNRDKLGQKIRLFLIRRVVLDKTRRMGGFSHQGERPSGTIREDSGDVAFIADAGAVYRHIADPKARRSTAEPLYTKRVAKPLQIFTIEQYFQVLQTSLSGQVKGDRKPCLHAIDRGADQALSVVRRDELDQDLQWKTIDVVHIRRRPSAPPEQAGTSRLGSAPRVPACRRNPAKASIGRG